MGMKKKTFIGAVMLAGILAIGQNVDAAGFESRLIKQTGLSLGGAEILKGTSYSTMVVSTESNQQGNLPFYTNPASSKRLTETWGNEEITHTLNLFCEDKSIQIGSVNGGSVLYTGDQFHPNQSNIYNWILSEQENDREEFLTEGHVQKTIWYLLGDEDYNTKTALYLEAEKYDEYIKNRTTPTFKATNASKVEPYDSGLKAGPFKVSYYSTYYGDTKFGNITGIQIIDANGNEVPSSDWTLMSEAGGAISTPTSGLNFYIYFKTMNIVGPVNVKFSFNVVEAASNYVNLSGTIHVAANSYTGYCDDCKPYASYTIIDGVATEQATAWGSCGNNATVVCPMGCVHQVFCSCNSTHTTSGNSDGNDEGNGTCSKQGWGTYTKHVHACGCGKYVRVNHFTHIKTGADGINSFTCGKTVSWEDRDVPSQPLMCGWGTRTNSAGILSAEIELNSVDLSLRKFITAVNGVAISTSRKPSYNTTSLDSNNNKTPATATYSHPKDPVDVARGDIVTYTIRVYNEGSDVVSYAKEIKDYLPDYLEYVDNSFNQSYGWSASGNVVTTSYLADKPINAYVINSGTLSYQDVEIQCKVSDSAPRNKEMVNNAEISKYAVSQGGTYTEISLDRDSTPNNISSASEDDNDYEVVKLTLIEDLALRKFITDVNGAAPTANDVTSNRVPLYNASVLNSGQNRTPATATYSHPKDPVDVKRGDIVTYTIRIYNEGSDLNAYAREIKDYLPDYLEYVDNEFNNSRGWSASGKVVTTRGLQNTEIAKYVIGSNTLSSADIQIQCKVATNTPYYQLIVNKAEISVYGHKQQNGNIYESNRDRDSRGNNIDLNNYNPPADNSKYQEDDDDYEQVKLMLTDFYGTVWIDGLETKQEERDGILTSNDAPYAGARVILHDNSKNDKQRETYTNEYGKYKFERLLIEDIYYTTFEYSGQEYIPVAVTELNSGNYTSVNSAGAERGTARADLNAKFYEIEQGAAVNKNNASRVTLEYAHIAEGNVRESLINKGTQEFINASKIQAHTVNFKGNVDYANYINLGLIERAQVDLGLMTDISQVDLTINGERATYNWGERSEDTAFDMAAKLKDLDRVYKQMVYTSDYNFRIEDYKDYEGKLDPTRTPEIELQAYITYKVMVKNTSSKSASLSKLNIYYDNYAFEYFNKTYDNHNENISDLKTNHSWYVKGSSQGTVVWQNTKQDAFTGYNEMSTSSTKNIVLEPNESVYIYVRFQAKKHTEGTRVREFTPNERYIVAEIAAYTTDDGLIDIDSQPDNVSLSKPWDSYMATMEDDTCRSPGFIIPDPESSDPGTSKERQMTGFVFEDSLTTEDDGIRHGDGIYNPSNGDRLENDVTVQLVEIVNVNGTDYEYIWQETKTGSKTAKYMSKAGGLYSNKPEKNLGEVGLGYYKFAEYIPGNYVVRFKYGDNIVGQQVVLSGQDYKSTTNRGFGNNQSCADDNMFRRYEVMKYSEVQSFVKSAILSNDLNQIKLMTKKDIENYLSTAPTTEITAVKQTDAAGEIDVIGTALKILRYNTWMNANTSIFKVTINQTSPGSSINFGVEPRPIAELEAIKTIEDIKITNKGIIILDSEMGIGQEVTKERVQAFQMDDELINGAVVSVKYNIQIKNVGEKDNLYNYFKGNTLGKADLNVNQKETSKTTALLVFDYPQNIGYSEEVQENRDNWKKATEEDKQKLSQMVQGVIRTGQNIMTIQPTNNILYQELSINEETNAIPVILSRIISIQSNDNLVYNNMVEIIMAKNTVGRRAEKSVFGNYKPINTSNSLKTNPTEPDSDATTVTIINPQGKKFNPHYEIWIISLSLLIGGIIIIKKTVLNKRNSF